MEKEIIERVEKLLDQDQFDQLGEVLQPFLEKDPKAKELLGLSFLKQWKNEEAEEIFETLKNEFPNNADYYYYYGASLGQQAKGANMFKLIQIAPKSKEAFEKAIELDNQHVPAYWGLLRYYGNAPAMFGGYPKGKELADALASFNKKEAEDAYNFLNDKFGEQ
ncbi:tetratricopeptide repeat protein [Flammeovirga kamogawensis]|uniref:Tetratricopeptide repeat protein n=1 Tax=Flammeovirga kamogawensis TaxID=373891 RepID=A0ABX8GRE5_9BACT|nr:hypothetical protein [Flammeovirga kamogawensis]MBB6464022.1 tetratricopeptide (TPR) repeat protein [Flammeovirga kamogawensis]QWG06145.1 hypothetical protein KM029_12415 [Flammeovirga kamogawensis]TRX67977.1 hypothetical protein EO216_07440 [Flammeovirga kamogawensis]